MSRRDDKFLNWMESLRGVWKMADFHEVEEVLKIRDRMRDPILLKEELCRLVEKQAELMKKWHARPKGIVAHFHITPEKGRWEFVHWEPNRKAGEIHQLWRKRGQDNEQ